MPETSFTVHPITSQLYLPPCGQMATVAGPSSLRGTDGQPDDQGSRVLQVHPPGPDTNTVIDLFAIHGLDTTSQTTWTFRGDGGEVNWLQAPDMLPRSLPHARIFTCDWPSRLYRDVDTVALAISELARGLLLDIQAERNRQRAAKDRPLAFVASCLGGIVLSQAIIMATEPGSDYADLGKAISGVVFLATPFRGTSLAYYFNMAVLRLSMDGFFRGKALSRELLDNIGKSTTSLENLVNTFTQRWVANDRHCPIYCFYETRATELLKKGLPEWWSKYLADPKIVSRKDKPGLPLTGQENFNQNSSTDVSQLVERSSACLDIAHECIELDAKHGMMNKFWGPGDNNYKRVLEKIKQISQEISVSNIQLDSSAEASKLYKQASDSFVKNVPLADQQQLKAFKNARSMLESIKDVASSHPNYESRLTATCKKFKYFACRLEHYFRVVEVFFQVEDEHVALIWGSIAMTFKVREHALMASGLCPLT